MGGPKLDDAQFEWVMSRGRFSTHVKNFLYRVVVEGEQPLEVASDLGMGRSRPYSALAQFWRRYDKKLADNGLTAVVVFRKTPGN